MVGYISIVKTAAGRPDDLQTQSVPSLKCARWIVPALQRVARKRDGEVLALVDRDRCKRAGDLPHRVEALRRRVVS